VQTKQRAKKKSAGKAIEAPQKKSLKQAIKKAGAALAHTRKKSGLASVRDLVHLSFAHWIQCKLETLTLLRQGKS
jgi:hypothetical protein